MALKDKQSLYDTVGKKGIEGGPVSSTDPTVNPYYRDGGNVNDHLVDLLSKRVKSLNTEQKYPSDAYFRPPSQDLDLEGIDGGNGFFHGKLNPGKGDGKQVGGVDLHEYLLTNQYDYNHGASTPASVGPAPGPTGHSEFQDMDGIDFGGTYNNGRYKHPETGQTYETQG